MTGRQRLPLTPVDVLVLRAVNRFRYLTAAQLNRLLWPDNVADAHRYAQRRLQRLVQDEYLLPLHDLPRPSTGTAPRVHALAWRGRQALLDLGEEVPSYYRPSELAESARNPAFLPHTLAVIDVLIAADRLTDLSPAIRLEQLRLEQHLRRLAPRAMVPGVDGRSATRQVTVVPDAIFSVSVRGERQDFVLELDRGTERQQAWRDKIAGLTYWISSPASTALLPSSYVTVMIVTSDNTRREYLREWTAHELRLRGLFEDYAAIFAITSASPVTLSPQAFFGRAHWHPPYIGPPDSLINLPADAGVVN